MKALIRIGCLLALLLSGWALDASAALTVITHSANGTLADGYNRLVAGSEFVLPAAGVGSRFLVSNETGQSVNIVPGQATLAIGSLAAGHQGLLDVAGRLDLIQTTATAVTIWQGTVNDGGTVYPPATADIAVAPAALAFGQVTIGNSSGQLVTITNAGTANLVLGTLAGTNPLAAPFSLAAGQDGCSGKTLAPAASCTVTVTFAPSAATTYADSFDIPSNDPATPSLSYAVSGSGVDAAGSADISVSPGSAAFGTIDIGSSADQVVTVSNVGTADLVLGTLGGSNALDAPFSLPVAENGCSGITLAPAGSCTVTVHFAPTAATAYSDSFNIPSNDPATPSLTFAVSGSGTGGAATVATNFSDVGLGSGVPAGWSERWETGSADYNVLQSIDFPGQNELNVYSTTGARRLISYDAADNLGPDVDELMLFKDPVNEGSIHTDFRLYARASGAAGTESAYYFTTSDDQTGVGIYKNVNGVLTPLDTGNGNVAFNTTDEWWVRFQVQGHNQRIKMWPYGSVEPRDWQLVAVDDSLTASGWQGIGNYYLGNHIFYQFAAAALPDLAQPVGGFGIVARPVAAVNLDAETLDTRGWTNEFGELRVDVDSSLSHSGSAHFYGGAGNFRAYQRIDLAANGVTQADLNAGTTVAFHAWQRALSYGDDPGRIGLRVLDAAGNEISSIFTDWDYKNSVYIPKDLYQHLPTNAAYVDLLLEGQLVRGSASSAYFDDLEVTIGVKQ